MCIQSTLKCTLAKYFTKVHFKPYNALSMKHFEMQIKTAFFFSTLEAL